MRRWILGLIIFLGFTVRIIGISSLPSGFTPDEASFGYDAYSILKTGRDQWGKSFPLVLESFGDYKAPLYTYLTIPSIAVFGLNKFAVRLPSAIIGSLAVVATYLLTSKLFGRKAGLFTSFFLAISPWHIMLSRGAFEANLTTFFLPLGIFLLLERKYAVGALLLGLNLFTYHTAKFLTPAVLIIYLLLYKDQMLHDFKEKRSGVISAAFIFLIFSVLTGYTFFMGAGARVSERSITSGALEAAFADRVNLSKSVGSFGARLVFNKYTVTARRFIQNYLSYFSPQFLFVSGPREATYGMIPGRGVLYLFVIPFFFGLGKAFNKENRKSVVFLVSWILLSLVPASFATGVGLSANRVAAAMPAIDILLGLGAYLTFEYLAKRKLAYYGYFVVIAVFFGSFLFDYFISSPKKVSKEMLYGNLEAANLVLEKWGDRQILVDKSISEPHIYFAFAGRINPVDYQNETKNWKYKEMNVSWVDQMPEYKLGNITFKDLKKSDIRDGVVLVGRPDDFNFDMGGRTREEINYPDGKPSIYIYGL